jgi:hypothetical protein
MSDLHETAALIALLRRGDRPWHRQAALVEQHKWARSYAQRPGTHVVNRPDEISALIERLAFAEGLSP